MVPLSNPSDHELQAVKPPSGHSGVYRVTFVLCIPGKDYFRSELDIERIIHAGESLLQMPSGAGEIEITVAGSVPVIFSAKTDGGVMSHVTMRIETESFIDAERFAYDRVMPILSYWSYLYDVALDITGYDVLEEETGIRKFSLGLVGMIKAFNEHEEYISTPEHRRLFAAYREGMNATNLFYQVLSFFKVSEGIRSLWKRRHRKAGRKGTLVNECVERFPDRIEELQIGDVLSIEAFRPHLGKELVAVLDEYRSLIRDAVAHLQQMDDVLDADNYDDITKCEQAVPVLRHIARSLLANELSSQQSTTSVAGQFRE